MNLQHAKIRTFQGQRLPSPPHLLDDLSSFPASRYSCGLREGFPFLAHLSVYALASRRTTKLGNPERTEFNE